MDNRYLCKLRANGTMKRAIFLDRDGVINVDKRYCNQVSELELCPGLVQGLTVLHSLGFLSVVVSNQSGVARGYYRLADVLLFHQAINTRLLASNAPPIDLFLFCPHLPQGEISEYALSCFCRKPSPGMIDQATYQLNLDLSQSWLIGDRWSDIEAGWSRGVRSIQIQSGAHPKVHRNAFATALDFLEAAQVISKCEKIKNTSGL